MNTKKKRFAPKKRLIKHFLALTLAGSLLLPGLVLIRSERVEANIIADMAGGVVGRLRYNATIAEIIVSLLAGNGTAVTNTSYLNKINSSYGIESSIANATGTDGTIGAMMDAGLFSIADDGTFIDNGLLSAIQSQPAYTECNINSIMGTWNEDHTAIETTAATNLGGAIGAGTVLGTLCQVGGAFMIGYNLGNLAVNFTEQYGQRMATKQAIEASNYKDNVPAGHYYVYGSIKNGSGNYFESAYLPNGFYAYWVPDDNSPPKYRMLLFNPTYTPKICYTNFSTSGYGTPNYSQNINAKARILLGGQDYITAQGNIPITNLSSTDMSNYLNNAYDNGQLVSPVYSPDVIGKNGNQRASNYQDVNNPESWPDIGNTLPEGQGITAIPWDDYMDFVNDANINTNSDITTTPQADIFNNFIEDYFVTPQELPDVQTPDYNPTVPEQPVPNPKEELTSEQSQENTDYMTTPGLKDVFPFSIPWDIAGLFNVFSTDNREAPVITFPIKSQLFGIDEEITLDFSVYEDVAALLRLLELIAFALGLAYVTRYLIGAGGG